MRRRPRVNHEVLERATLLGCWFKRFFRREPDGARRPTGPGLFNAAGSADRKGVPESANV